MSASGNLITVCEAIKSPLFSEVRISGIGTFSDIAIKIADHIFDEFNRRGYITSSVGWKAMHTSDGKTIYCNEEKKHESEAHEGFHDLINKAKIKTTSLKDPAKSYFKMLEESAATAVNEYALFQQHNGSETIRNSISIKRRFGNEVYLLLCQALSGHKVPDEEIAALADRTIVRHKAKNWASLLVDADYFGLLDPCYMILEKSGMEKGIRRLTNLATILRDDSSADTFFEKLQEYSGKTILRIPPTKEKNVIKGIFKYKGMDEDDDNYIYATFSGPKKEQDGIEKCEFLPQIKNSFIQKYGEELDRLGILWMNAWGNEIIFSGHE